jgi:hypothetical protein
MKKRLDLSCLESDVAYVCMVFAYSISSTPVMQMRERVVRRDTTLTIEDCIEGVTDVERVLEECVGHVFPDARISKSSGGPELKMSPRNPLCLSDNSAGRKPL